MVQMKQGETLKPYISHFQNQMALIYYCNDDVVAAAFISGLEINHSYKHLMKHDVTNMKGILSRAQNIQLEEATKNTTNRSKYETGASHKTQGHSWGMTPTSW